MKKSRLITVILAIFVFAIIFAAIGKREKESAVFEYPDQEEFTTIFSEVNPVHWIMEGKGNELEGSEETIYSKTCQYMLKNETGQMFCQFRPYLTHENAVGLMLTFLPINYDAESVTEEEYEHLLREELPELWILASHLCSDPAAVLDLQKRMETSYEQVLEPEQYRDKIGYFSEWGGQSAGICATARLVKSSPDSQPMWYELRLVSKAEYNESHRIMKELPLYEIKLLTEKEADIDPKDWQKNRFTVYGKLSEITEAEDFRVSFATPGLPENRSFYQKATLTDESGSMTVYIAPTALSRKELESKRMHLLQAVNENCYVITDSCLKKE